MLGRDQTEHKREEVNDAQVDTEGVCHTLVEIVVNGVIQEAGGTGALDVIHALRVFATSCRVT